MGRLIYSAIASLDGFIEDGDGSFDWGEPDAEVHGFVNGLMRPVATYLYGRRMYEVMLAWETWELAGEPEQIRDFAEIWRGADKVVYSSTLKEATSARTRIERSFDAEAVRRLKDADDRDLAVAGPQLAGQAFAAGLVDECQLFVAPVAVGGGKRSLPEGLRVDLELLDERRFDSGFVHLRYRVGAS